MQFQAEQVGLDGTIRKTLHEQINQRLLIGRICCNVTRKMTYVLNVRVYITFGLFDIQEFRVNPEVSSRWFECLSEPEFEDF